MELRRRLQMTVALFFVCVGVFFYWSSQACTQKPSPQKPPPPPKQEQLSPEDAKEALTVWVALCAPCHTIQGTGTDFGPPLLGPGSNSRLQRFTQKRLVSMFERPEDHGIPEAAPALRKLNPQQRTKLAAWLITLKKPEDIVVETNMEKPPPFIFVQNCAGCHGPDATGGIGPNLHGVKNRRAREVIIKLIADPKTAGITSIMPTFEELSEEERTEIADWLYSLEE